MDAGSNNLQTVEHDFSQPSSSTKIEPVPPMIELTKDGNVSKMRLHKGNVPSLPQTKLCPICPAKFTRTTHLNRHLRTHTNERLHECDRCHSQFTRSDLLTRHKRSCGDSSSVNRSRRKSCKGCADSKVKCDLQHPCSKCKARNRECIYVTGPTAVSTRRASTSQTMESDEQKHEVDFSIASSSRHPPPHTSHDDAPHQTDHSHSPASASTPEAASDKCNTDSPSSSSAIHAETVYPSTDNTVMLDTRGPNYLNELFSTEMFDDLFDNIFTSNWQRQQLVGYTPDPTVESTDIIIDRLESTSIGSSPEPTFPFPTEPVEVPHGSLPLDFQRPEAYAPSANSPTATGPSETGWPVAPSAPPAPSPAVLHHYLCLFFGAYLENMPIVHVATFEAQRLPPILLSAMRACGALYVRTQTAIHFIDSTLASARDELIAEFAKTPTDYEHLVHLTLTISLLQTIGLFHRSPEQRAASNVYHGMIVMMIRMSGFIERTVNWEVPNVNVMEPLSVESAWREWIIHETGKRALWICYLHDCCHTIYFNLRATFLTKEFNLGLPCEDGLWAARSASDWSMVLQTPSPYGSTTDRLCGTYLQPLYARFTEIGPELSPPFICNPFSHLILIHAIMRILFEEYLENRLPDGGAGGTPSVHEVRAHEVSQERILTLQVMLHHWLQSWMNSPESPRAAPDYTPPFITNALPFYWLAQVGILAYQHGLPPFSIDATYILSGEAKFRLMKKWEKHIRTFLKTGEQAPTMFWDEVMKTRIQSWQEEMAANGVGTAHSENLLGFFPET